MNTKNMNTKKINLELNIDEVNVILGSLGEIPAKISMAMIQKIHNAAQMLLAETKDDPVNILKNVKKNK